MFALFFSEGLLFIKPLDVVPEDQLNNSRNEKILILLLLMITISKRGARRLYRLDRFYTQGSGAPVVFLQR